MLREGERRDPIIAEVMQEKNIDPDDVLHFTTRPTCILYDPHNLDSVRGSQRYFRVRGFAWYRQHDSTTGCSRTWASAHSWGILDLREQKIVHRYGQECRTCGGKGTPSFSEEARGRMAEYACQQHLYRTKREQRPAVNPDMRDLSGQRDGPHDSSNCDMCKLLGNSCNNARDRPGWRDSSGWNACDTKKLGGSSGGSCNSRHRTSSQAGKGAWNLEYTSIPPPPKLTVVQVMEQVVALITSHSTPAIACQPTIRPVDVLIQQQPVLHNHQLELVHLLLAFSHTVLLVRVHYITVARRGEGEEQQLTFSHTALLVRVHYIRVARLGEGEEQQLTFSHTALLVRVHYVRVARRGEGEEQQLTFSHTALLVRVHYIRVARLGEGEEQQLTFSHTVLLVRVHYIRVARRGEGEEQQLTFSHTVLLVRVHYTRVARRGEGGE